MFFSSSKGEKMSFLKVVLPDSILSISRISFTKRSSFLEEISIRERYSCRELCISESFKTSINPIIAFNGVLISWLILDMNSVLDIDAFSALNCSFFNDVLRPFNFRLASCKYLFFFLEDL